jgi:molecular chaperone GrpE
MPKPVLVPPLSDMTRSESNSDQTSPTPDSPDDQGADGPEFAMPESTATDALSVAKKEAADNYDRYVRLASDLENFRKRAVREKEELRLFATSRVLEDLLPVLDNLGLGLAAAKQSNADLKTLTGGVDLVLNQLKSALATHGLKEISPLGLPFDPHSHEAISHQPSVDVKEEHVLLVVRPGYSLNGRLLRPASVIVSSGPARKDTGKA